MRFFTLVTHLLPKIQLSLSKKHFHCAAMACSRFEYVKEFEQDDTVLRNVWIIIRVDGKGFHKFTQAHNFEKPNDVNALNLMSAAAVTVMEDFRDIVLAYGQSDEYSFVFRRETNIFKRRAAKLLSYVTSLFTSAYVLNWSHHMSTTKLQYAPCFDGRIVLYPTDQNLKDYLSWRQADVHVNNLYNTAFWSLVDKSGYSNQEAEAKLRGTFADDKNELLFQEFGINYNNLPVMFRKGTILLRKRVRINEAGNKRQLIVPLHVDMIKERFWQEHAELLQEKYVPAELDLAVEQQPSEDALLQMQLQKLNLNNVT